MSTPPLDPGIDLPALWQMAHETQRANYHSVHHGIEHWTRVERNGLWLAGQVPDVDVLLVRLFAALHDCKRQDDGYDTQHGPRAAEFVSGLDLPLDPSRKDRLVVAIRSHTFGPTESNDITIQVCHDADRLDLGRVAIQPSADYLNTEPARDLARRDAVEELDSVAASVTLPERLTPTPRWDQR